MSQLVDRAWVQAGLLSKSGRPACRLTHAGRDALDLVTLLEELRLQDNWGASSASPQRETASAV